jgi:hypothetical protein
MGINDRTANVPSPTAPSIPEKVCQILTEVRHENLGISEIGGDLARDASRDWIQRAIWCARHETQDDDPISRD